MWGLVLLAGIIVGGVILVRHIQRELNKRENTITYAETEAIVPTSSEGISIPALFGTVDVPNPNCIWYGDFSSEYRREKDPSDPGGGEAEWFYYYLGLHLAICMDAADALLRIVIDEKEAWPNQQLDPESPGYWQAYAYFGNHDVVFGEIGFLDGNPSQSIPDYFQTLISLSSIPAYRGITSFFTDGPWLMGTSNYIKRFGFRVQRIHKSWDYTDQWYDAKAAIPLVIDASVIAYNASFDYIILSTETISKYLEWYRDDPQTFMWRLYNEYYGALSTGQGPFGTVAAGTTPPYSVNTVWPINMCMYAKKDLTLDGLHALKLKIYFEDGIAVWFDSNKIDTDGIYLDSMDHTGETITLRTYIIPIDMITAGPHVIHVFAFDETENKGSSDTSYLSIEVEFVNYETMNPAHILREAYTHPDWGMGKNPNRLNASNLTEIADTLYNEGFGLCMKWTKESSIEEFINEILRHINGHVRLDHNTGLISFKLVRDDYTVEELPLLDESNIEKIINFKKPAMGELVNQVTVNYHDLHRGKTGSISVQDIALLDKEEVLVSKTVKFPWIASATLATQVARRELDFFSSELASFDIYTHYNSFNIYPGDVIRVSWAELGISEMVVRVTGKSIGDGRNNMVVLKVVQDVFSLPDDGISIETGNLYSDDSSSPYYPTYNNIYEQPYLELIQNFGILTVTSLLSTYPTAGSFGCGFGRLYLNSNQMNVYVDEGSGYISKGLFDTFAPRALLAQDISRMDTTFDISDGDLLANVTTGTWCQIDNELMSVVSISSTSLTVKRAVLDTVPTTHLDNTFIVFWDAYNVSDNKRYYDGEVIDIKLCSVTKTGIELPLEESIAKELEFNARAIRPYPPADLKVEGTYFPTSELTGDVELTWVGRNRLNESIIGFTDAGETAEAGTTYTVILRNPSTQAVLLTASAISSNSYTISDIAQYSLDSIEIELKSVRSGYDSYYSHIFIVNVSPASPALSFEFPGTTYTPPSGSAVGFEF